MARTRSSHTEKLRARRSGRRQSKSTLRRPGSASSGARRGLASALGKIEGRKSTAAKVLRGQIESGSVGALADELRAISSR